MHAESKIIREPNMLSHKYTYEQCLKRSEQVCWKIENVLGTAGFDFGRPFMPERLAQVEELSFLKEHEKLKLNQIRGYSYLLLFEFVEEFIVAQIMQLAHAHRFGDEIALRALLRFAEEEVKHQALFARAQEIFRVGFGSECAGITGRVEVANVVLSKSELAVMLLTDMLEWMTQLHYLEFFRDAELDPTFKDILKNHWIEEAQHTKLNSLEISRLAAKCTPEQRERAVDEVLEIGGAFDGLLKAQALLDITSLEQAVNRFFTEGQKAELLERQHRAYRYTFLVSALRHPNFAQVVSELTEGGSAKLSRAADALSQ